MYKRQEEVEHAEEEGIIFKTLCNPVEIHANDEGFVKSITCIEMEPVSYTHLDVYKRQAQPSPQMAQTVKARGGFGPVQHSIPPHCKMLNSC